MGESELKVHVAYEIMQVVINRRPVDLPVIPIVTLIVLLVAGFTTLGIGRIQADQIGVLVNNLTGNVEVRTQPGASIYNAWITDFYVLDNTEQSYPMDSDAGGGDAVNIKTRDGADVELDVVINYRLVADPKLIRERIVPECGLERIETAQGEVDAYKRKWIRDYARSVIRYQFGELTPNSFYIATERDEKRRQSLTELNTLLNPHGIEVSLVAPKSFSFYPELERLISDKKAAEQEVDAETSRAAAAEEAKNREKTKATAERNKAIASVQGELRQAILEAEAAAEKEIKAAEAYAYSTRTEAEAGFYKAQNDAKSLLARAEAEADGLTRLAQSLSGDGADQIIRMRYAEALRNARITGVPYATDPRIQKVDVSLPGMPGAAPTNAGGGASSSGGAPAEKGGQ